MASLPEPPPPHVPRAADLPAAAGRDGPATRSRRHGPTPGPSAGRRRATAAVIEPHRHHRRHFHPSRTRRPRRRAPFRRRTRAPSPTHAALPRPRRLAALARPHRAICWMRKATPSTRWWRPSSRAALLHRRGRGRDLLPWLAGRAAPCRRAGARRGRAAGRAGRIHAARLPEWPHRPAAGRSRPRPDRSHHAIPGAHRRAAGRRLGLAPHRARSRNSCWN